jgi:DNA invertase Pin-like site-specific DNA recombinase
MRIPAISPLPAGSTVWGCLRDSGGDAQERSIDQQLAELRAYCQQHQLLLGRVFSDEARQGDSAERRGALQAMLEEVRGRFPQIHDRQKRERAVQTLRHGIIFWNFARLGRDRLETAYIRNDLRMRGLVIISLSDDILTGNALVDSILEGLIDYHNEQFLDTLSKDVKRGLHDLVAMRDTHPDFLRFNPEWQPTGRYLGIFPGRIAPRGFCFERITIGQRRDGRLRIVQRLVPDDQAWQRCLMAWRMRIEDHATLEEIHTATGLYRSLAGYGPFFASRIYLGILDYGDQVYGNLADPFVRPMVSTVWFDLEAERREKRGLRRQKGGQPQPGVFEPQSHRYGRILSGLLVCQRCGARLHAGVVPAGRISTSGQMRAEWPFYWCGAAKEKHCDAGKVSAHRLEEAILERLRDEVFSPEQLRKHADQLLRDLGHRRRRLLEDLEALETSLAEAHRQAQHLADALAQRPSSPTLLSRLDQVEAQQTSLAHDIQLKQSELAYWSAFEVDDQELERVSARIITAIQSRDRVKARLALSSFIREIVVEPGKNFHAHIRYTVKQPGNDLPVVPVPLRGTEVSVRRRAKKDPPERRQE